MAAQPVRRGLVLGAGGVLGAAWTIGALSALQEVTGADPRESEALVGTSAGSVLAAFLGCGVGVDSLLNHQRGVVVEGDPVLDYDYDTDSGGSRPPRPKLGSVGSVGLLRRNLRHPFRVTPMAMFAGLLPEGRGSLAPVGAMVDAVTPRTDGLDSPLELGAERGHVVRDVRALHAAVSAGVRPGEGWAPHRNCWVVAMNYETGRRTVFGRPDSPPAVLPDAVMASCAIPGWYAPVVIDGSRYVDGGACSPTSVDVLAELELDEVVVLAPMATLDPDHPNSMVARLERQVRKASTRRIQHEAAKLEAHGTRVALIAPGHVDLAVIGPNMMDPARREEVLATSLATSKEALERALSDPRPVAEAG